MDIKQKAAYISAILAFVMGWYLVFAAFYMPPKGEVSDSILWILGQALIYTASVFGITMYFKSEIVKLRGETRKVIREEIQEEKAAEE